MNCRNCDVEIDDNSTIGDFCSYDCKDEFLAAWADYRYDAMVEERLMEDRDE